MKAMITIILALGIVDAAAAQDLGNRMPTKPAVTYPVNIPYPDRQGGDTILDATLISALPYADSGTTTGYNDDYDEICPYDGSHSPDVVYKFTPPYTTIASIDLCGSIYDTKVYVYDSSLQVVACNDDYYTGPPCGEYTSRIECAWFTGGETSYIVVDGYGGDFGDYLLDVSEWIGCDVVPPEGILEGEPPLHDGYEDIYNGGCSSHPDPIFQQLEGQGSGELTFCGRAGWYLYDGANCRDTDWFIVTCGSTGQIEITGDADYATMLYELAPQDCQTATPAQEVQIGPCWSQSLTVTCAPGATVWLWVGSAVFTPADCYPGVEYDYVLWISGLQDVVATRTESLGSIRALFR